MSTILYIGNVGPDSHATYTTENHVARDAESLGHTVIPVMEGQRCHEQALEVLRSQRVDLVLYTRTEGLRWAHQDALMVWDEAARLGVPTASLHLDLFWGIGRRDVKVTRENALFGVDVAFTADGGHQDEFAAAGINHVWLPPAVVSDEVGRGTPRAEYAGEVAFVGSSRGYHDEWPRRREMVAAAERRFGAGFVRAGDGRTVREWDLNDLYASVKCSVGDSLAPDLGASLYWSDRLTEAAGRGSILVHPYIAAACDQLGDAVVWCDWDVDEQMETAAAVCEWSDDERDTFITHAIGIIRDGHTYAHRVQSVLDHLGIG